MGDMRERLLPRLTNTFKCVTFAITLMFSNIAYAGEVVVHSDNGTHTFTVEVMRSSQERAKGLMFREYLAPGAGMLFDFGEPRPVSMWMKNTYISLDMLFISKEGVIHKIAEKTTPHSTEIISSNSQVKYVLEINGGLSAKFGIKPGNQVILP